MADLSEELDIDLSTLKRCISFFKTYKGAPRGTNLSWTHYRMLIPLKDKKEREWYETLVEEKNLNGEQLRNAIKNNRFDLNQKSKGKRGTAKTLKRPVDGTYLRFKNKSGLASLSEAAPLERRAKII